MSSTASKLLVIAGVAAVAIALFIFLKDNNEGSENTAPVSTSKMLTSGRDGSTKSNSAENQKQTPVVKVKDGAPVGSVKQVEVKKGETVRLKVESDMKGSIHVHGYNVMKNVTAGGSVIFSFPAKFDGRFEVEAHFGKHKQIAEIVVEP